MDTSQFISATVETTPPLRVYLERTDDAARLATATGCRVRVETVYEPATPAERSTNGVSARSVGPSASAPIAPPSADMSVPEQVRQQINAHPDRTFRASDFSDLGDQKRITNVLYRLAMEQKVIRRVGHGEYRAPRSSAAAAAPPAADRVTAGPKVLAYMQQHPGEWLRAAEITEGMGLAEDRRGAIGASLSRLADAEHLNKKGGSYCFPRARQPGRSDLREGTNNTEP